MRRVDPLFACCAAVLAIASASIFIRFAQEAGAPSPIIAAARLAFASCVLVPLALLLRRDEIGALRRRDVGFAVLAGGFLALHFLTWIASLELTSLSSSVVIMSTAPIWVALLAPLVLKEPLTRSVCIGALLSVAGGIVVGFQEDGGAASDPALGNALALVGALGLAGYFIAGRRVRIRVSLLTYVALTYGAGAIFAIAALPFMGARPGDVPVEGWAWCILIALVPQLIGHSIFNWGLRYLPAATVSVLMLGEPVGAILLAIPVFQVWPGWEKSAGIVVILIGIQVAARVPKARG